VRQLLFDASAGFFLNSVAMKIKGYANHQDFAGVGFCLGD
jgi:hypothetical protein